jgi:hypothetical protein
MNLERQPPDTALHSGRVNAACRAEPRREGDHNGQRTKNNWQKWRSSRKMCDRRISLGRHAKRVTSILLESANYANCHHRVDNDEEFQAVGRFSCGGKQVSNIWP